jgi:Prp8 binding protein
VLFSASADMHLASWDLETGLRIRRHVGHEEIINCMDVSRRGEEVLISGSDDGYIGIWDPRTKNAVDFIPTEFPVTAVAMSEAGNELYSGSIDNDIKVWDMRRKEVVYSMLGHTDTVSSLRVSPDSQTLLSNSMDSTVRTWDIRPFAPTDRHLKTFDGASAGIEKNLIKASWSGDGKKVAAGSADGTAVVWSNETGKLMYKLPGHQGCVNDVELHPTEPISKFPFPNIQTHITNHPSSLRILRSKALARRAEVNSPPALNRLPGRHERKKKVKNEKGFRSRRKRAPHGHGRQEFRAYSMQGVQGTGWP